MSTNYPSEKEILKTVLEPLLEDFQYWFARSRSLLERERLSFLKLEEQENLLERVKTSQQEVSTMQMLFKVTEGKVGVETAVLIPWHNLVAECWQVAMQWRTQNKSDSV